MPHLAVANVMHYKLRSALSVLGIGIGVCMLITFSGLSRGSLYEISDRWEAVDADLIVYPRIWGDNITTLSGVGLSDGEAGDIVKHHGDLVERVVPAFLWQMDLAGQGHVAVGADSDERSWKTLTGGRAPSQGAWCDAHGQAAAWLVKTMLQAPPNAPDQPAMTEQQMRGELAERGGFELVIDSRLARAGHYKVGDTVSTAGQDWRIVGVLPAGGMGRAFLPRRTAQFLFAGGNIKVSTLMFVKLKGGVDPLAAAGRIRSFSRQAILVRQYRQMLEQKWKMIFLFVDSVNALAVGIAFLFIMVTLYTMVLQRTRDIAILRSCGAGGAFILRQVLAESAILTAAGFLVGTALSFPVAWGIQIAWPLLTVTITWHWIALAAGVAALGAVVSALYPAWRATRVDVAEALTLE